MRRLLVADRAGVTAASAKSGDSELAAAKAAIRVATLLSVLSDVDSVQRAAAVCGESSATVEKVLRAVAQST